MPPLAALGDVDCWLLLLLGGGGGSGCFWVLVSWCGGLGFWLGLGVWGREARGGGLVRVFARLGCAWVGAVWEDFGLFFGKNVGCGSVCAENGWLRDIVIGPLRKLGLHP
jgi:hypothetical protein